MTPIADFELSRQLSALRIPPPDNGFGARLRVALQAEAPVAARPRPRVLRFSGRRRPLALLALGTLAFGGAAAAAIDGRVWRAIVAVTAPAPRVPTPADTSERPRRTRHSSSTEHAATPPALDVAATAPNTTAPGTPPANAEPASSALLSPPAPPLAARRTPSLPPRAPGAERSRSESAPHTARPETASSHREHPDTVSSRSAPDNTAVRGVPRLDLGDLPRPSERGDAPRSDSAASERLRDLAGANDPGRSARDRATEARERATDRNRGADRPRRSVDAPALDVERERQGSDARDRDDANREGRNERGSNKHEGR